MTYFILGTNSLELEATQILDILEDHTLSEAVSVAIETKEWTGLEVVAIYNPKSKEIESIV